MEGEMVQASGRTMIPSLQILPTGLHKYNVRASELPTESALPFLVLPVSRLPSSQRGHRDDLKAIAPGMLQLLSTVIYGYDSISCERYNCVLSCFVRRLLCSSDGCSKMLDEITGSDTEHAKIV